MAVPPGETPLWVREKWVGLELPLNRWSSSKQFRTPGVLSAPSSYLVQLWAAIRGRTHSVAGYAVAAVQAVTIPETSSPDAVAWWRENMPHLLATGGYLVLHKEACRMVVPEPRSSRGNLSS